MKFCFGFYVVLALASCCLASRKKRQKGRRCEELTIPTCLNLNYNQTIFPNAVGHSNQEDAGLAVHQFYPLIKVECSPALTQLLCAVYAPVCTILNKPLPPCRDLCENAREGCITIMQSFDFTWPDELDCRRFPKDGLCVREKPESQTKTTTTESYPTIDWTNIVQATRPPSSATTADIWNSTKPPIVLPSGNTTTALPSVSKKPRKRKKKCDNSLIDKIVESFKQASNILLRNQEGESEFTAFGSLVAKKLEKLANADDAMAEILQVLARHKNTEIRI